MKKTLLITAILLVSAPGYCPADTIELHNGRIIHGKVAGELPAAGPVRISFTGGGSLTIDAASVRLLRRERARVLHPRPEGPARGRRHGGPGRRVRCRGARGVRPLTEIAGIPEF